MPWLYYGDQPGLASRVLRSEPLPIGYSFRGPNQVRVWLPDTRTITTKEAGQSVNLQFFCSLMRMYLYFVFRIHRLSS